MGAGLGCLGGSGSGGRRLCLRLCLRLGSNCQGCGCGIRLYPCLGFQDRCFAGLIIGVPVPGWDSVFVQTACMTARVGAA